MEIQLSIRSRPQRSLKQYKQQDRYTEYFRHYPRDSNILLIKKDLFELNTNSQHFRSGITRPQFKYLQFRIWQDEQTDGY